VLSRLMADPHHLTILSEGLETWNSWRAEHQDVRVDLSGADLAGLDLLTLALNTLQEAGGFPQGSSWTFLMNEVIGSDIKPLDLSFADMSRTRLDGANLRAADCRGSDFTGASLRSTNLERARLAWARLYGADLTDTHLLRADLSHAVLVESQVTGANFHRCVVYGTSVWDLTGAIADERYLEITPPLGKSLYVDNLRLAQTMNFLSRPDSPRDMIELMSGHFVLLLGNFSPDEKTALSDVGDEIRRMGYGPIIFDFDRPARKDTTGTVETLARLARFVIADLTNPSSVPHELASTVPHLRTTPVILLRQRDATGYSMAAYPWVLEVHNYHDTTTLLASIPDLVHRALTLGLGNGT
jgi:uncharacterized protein YjbI with pentapeptide repeats